ncbi:MAG: OmpH family outer membrane protein [Gammaproteobacteria bacterium]|nr:OmpH family outer membrane protein [Gammaproteobacteria bacterium]
MMTKTSNITASLMVGIALLMMSGFANAQQVKIGYVNFAQLLAESPQATSAMEVLQEEFAPRQREVVALQAELKEKQEQIQRDVDVMGPEERRNAENELRRDERELNRQQQEFTEDVNLRRNEALRKLQGELLREVQTYATQQGFDLVVAEGVVYASDAIDITAQVLAGLKAAFGAESGS